MQLSVLTFTRNNIATSHSLGQLSYDDTVFACACGKSGCTDQKQEGDHASPLGTYYLRHLYYRADRLQIPETNLPTSIITQKCGWSDDVNDPDYNQYIERPHPYRHEALWRSDHQYDILITLSHNQNPAVPGAGSAIFFHLAKEDFSGTEGCLAISQRDMLQLLPKLGPETKLIIKG